MTINSVVVNNVAGKNEADALFNPAFLALLARRFVDAYSDYADGAPVPYILPHIAVPLALNAAVREALTYSVASHLGAWTGAHPQLESVIPAYVVALQGRVRQGILFGVANDVVSLREGSFAAGATLILPMPPAKTQGDVAQCQRAARFLGRWFAKTNDVPNTCALLGVRP